MTGNGIIIDQIIPTHNSSRKKFLWLSTLHHFSNPIPETKTENRENQIKENGIYCRSTEAEEQIMIQ